MVEPLGGQAGARARLGRGDDPRSGRGLRGVCRSRDFSRASPRGERPRGGDLGGAFRRGRALREGARGGKTHCACLRAGRDHLHAAERR